MAYTAPTPATFKIRYPAFVDTDDATIQYWLTDAERIVGAPADSEWATSAAPIAVMLYAAHELTKQGLPGTGGASEPAGITSLRSGALTIAFSDDAAKASLSGWYDSTSYGREFAAMLKRQRGGIRLTTPGTPDYGSYSARHSLR